MRFVKEYSTDKEYLHTTAMMRVLFFNGSDKRIDDIIFFNKEREIKADNLHDFVDAVKLKGFNAIEFDDKLSVKRKDKRDKPFYLMKKKETLFNDKLYTLYLDMDKLNIKVVSEEEVERYDLFIEQVTIMIDGHEFTFETGNRMNDKVVKENNLSKVREYLETLEELRTEALAVEKAIEEDRMTDRQYFSGAYKLRQELDDIKRISGSIK